MKKFIVILCAATLLAAQAEARPFGGHHHSGWGKAVPCAHSHHHKGDAIAGFVTGLIGGVILNAAFNQPQPATVTTTSYAPVVYTSPVVTTTAVATTPTVISAPVAQAVPVTTTTTQPCYTTTNLVTGAVSTHCSSTIISSQVYIGN